MERRKCLGTWRKRCRREMLQFAEPAVPQRPFEEIVRRLPATIGHPDHGSEAALVVARDLDAKIEVLLKTAAG